VAYNFQTITVKDFGGGIDQKSSENAIKPGYSERLENVVTSSNGTLSKRPGYEGYYGWLPLRVKSVQKLAGSTDIKIVFDNAVSLLNIVPTPIVIYGRLSVDGITSGDFITDAELGHYYDTFVSGTPFEYTAPSGDTGGITTVNSASVMTTTLRRTVAGTSSNEFILIDAIKVDQLSPNDITYFWSGLASSIFTFMPAEAVSTVLGESYVEDYIAFAPSYTKSIPVGTHLLQNFNPVAQFYYSSGIQWVQFIPDDLNVDPSTGTIEITTTFPTNTSVKAVFKSSSATNIQTGTIVGSGSIVVNTDVDLYSMTVYDTAGNMIIPDGVVRDSLADTLSFNFTGIVGSENFTCVFIETDIQSNFLTVTDTFGDILESYDDDAPQLTVWGIPHEDIYFRDNVPAAEVDHIDSYRAEAEERIVAGITGVEYSAREGGEVSTEYRIGATSVSLDARSSAAVTIGPAFASLTETAVRTTGMLKDASITNNRAVTTGCSFVSAGIMRYQLSFTSPTGTLSGCISTTSGAEDYLTVSGMANSINNGSFKILAVSNVNYTIDVENSDITSTRFDESGARGAAGVLTDKFNIQLDADFLADDIITITSSQSLTVRSALATTVYIKDQEFYTQLPIGFKVHGIRTTDVVPVESTDDLVRGDMLILTGFDRKFRIRSINTYADISISSVSWSGTLATIILSLPNDGLEAGKRINILHTSDARLNGTHTISQIQTPTTIVVDTGYTGTSLGAGGVLQGKTIEIDEEVEIYDANTSMACTAVGRWIPMEAPSSDFDLVSNAHYQYFTAGGYIDQSTIRSTIINDNMYFTNYNDAVMKFDGTNISRAGVPYWQPQHMVSVSDTPASISLSGVLTGVTAVTDNRFRVSIGAQAIFQVGDTIIHTNDNATYIVTGSGSDTPHGFVLVDKTITGAASGNIRLASIYSYYFRLNVVDANGNIIAGAATGLGDYVVSMPTIGVINHKLIGLPAFDLYDHDRISVEVYRTNKTGKGTYYKIGTKYLSFNNGEGYITFTDATDDSLLSDVDSINTALLGTEASTGFSQPMRAKYVTSVNNKLVYSNLQTYPQIDISALPNAGFSAVTFSDFDGKTMLLRKDNLDTNTGSNMVDRVRIRYYTSPGETISAITVGSGEFTVTVTSPFSFPVATGMWIYLYRDMAPDDDNDSLRFAGWFQVSSTIGGDTVTVKSPFTSTWGAWSGTADVNRLLVDEFNNVPVLLATDYNTNQVGANDGNIYQILVRTAAAFNAAMRQVDTTIPGELQSFAPWASVQAGSSIGAGRIMFRQDLVLNTTMELVLPEVDDVDWYAFGELAASGDTATIQAQNLLYPSRAIISYPGYPEMFELPDQSDAEAPYVVDVNAADGEEITMIIPFFAESSFSASQVEAVLVVFKENSIYLLNTDNGQIQKMQSRGIGCTAPYSVALTKDGINFANNSGIYRINRNLTVSYVGEYLERIYQDEVNRDLLQNMTATHNAIGSQYKLSYTIEGADTNSNVFVYDYQREGRDQELGSWTTFTNHPVTGWANLGNNSFFATTNGQVYKIRNNNDKTDFRDDADAVDTMQIVLRADDFGISGERKLLRYVVSHFEMRTSDNTDTILSISYDLQTEFIEAEDFDFIDGINTKVKFAQSSMPRKKAVYFQLKYTNDSKDEAVVLAGVDYTVTKLSYDGVNQGGR
jgi:hypothetical protein